MFSSNNHSGGNGGNKGKRLSSFFQFGSSSNTGSPVSQSTVSKNNGSSGNVKGSMYPSGSKAFIENTQIKKSTTGRGNPFVPSSKPITVESRPSSSSSSHGMNSHRNNLSSHGSSGKRESSSHRHVYQGGSSSDKYIANSIDVKKKSASLAPTNIEGRARSSSSLSSINTGPNDLMRSTSAQSANRPSMRRRPPPPVDLSVLRNSMKRTSEPKQLRQETNSIARRPQPPDDFVVSNEVEMKRSPQLSPLPKDTDEHGDKEFHLEQHRRQISEAQKFEEELDTLIREHHTVGGTRGAQGDKKPMETELDQKIDMQGVLDVNLDFIRDANNEDKSPSSCVDPLKLSESPENGRLSTGPPSTIYDMRSSPLPRSISLPFSDQLQATLSEPFVRPPPPLPPKEPLESLPTAPTFLPSTEVTEVREDRSAAPGHDISATGGERDDRFSFTNSFSDDSLQNASKGAFDDPRDAPSIISTSYQGDSVEFLGSSESQSKLSPKATSVDLPASCSMNSFPYDQGEEDFGRNNEDIMERTSRNPFLDASILEQMASVEQSKTLDSDDRSSNRLFDQVSAIQSFDTEVQVLPRRKFRVVNESPPAFYINGFWEFSKTAGHEDVTKRHGSTYSKEPSIVSERSSTFIPMNTNNSSLKSSRPSLSVRSGFTSLDSGISEDETPTNGKSSKKETLLALGHNNLYSRQSLRSNKSNKSNKSNGSSNSTNSSDSIKHDKSVKLVSSYVEELRLKYYRSSNFLQAPPNLPLILKQKNNMVQSKNYKVKIRTSSEQIGIKHGGAKQKLLTLETTHEDVNEEGSMKLPNKERMNVNHTMEFQNLLGQKGTPSRTVFQPDARQKSGTNEDDDIEEFLNDIPGDDAYDSDDAMAPLRKEAAVAGVTRNSTVKSYFTKQQEKLHEINKASRLEKLPSNINIGDYVDNAPLNKTMSNDSGDSGVNGAFSYVQGLRVANPDSSSR